MQTNDNVCGMCNKLSVLTAKRTGLHSPLYIFGCDATKCNMIEPVRTEFAPEYLCQDCADKLLRTEEYDGGIVDLTQNINVLYDLFPDIRRCFNTLCSACQGCEKKDKFLENEIRIVKIIFEHRQSLERITLYWFSDILEEKCCICNGIASAHVKDDKLEVYDWGDYEDETFTFTKTFDLQGIKFLCDECITELYNKKKLRNTALVFDGSNETLFDEFPLIKKKLDELNKIGCTRGDHYILLNYLYLNKDNLDNIDNKTFEQHYMSCVRQFAFY